MDSIRICLPVCHAHSTWTSLSSSIQSHLRHEICAFPLIICKLFCLTALRSESIGARHHWSVKFESPTNCCQTSIFGRNIDNKNIIGWQKISSDLQFAWYRCKIDNNSKNIYEIVSLSQYEEVPDHRVMDLGTRWIAHRN